jgi:proline dehydrogenase
MRLWQQGMIAMARSRSIQRFMQAHAGMTRLARRFVGGGDPRAAVAEALALHRRGITASLFYLGEYVTDPRVIGETVQKLNDILEQLALAGLDLHISVDPTQIGTLCGPAEARNNTSELGRRVHRAALSGQGGRRNWVMLDMEDHSMVDLTLDLYQALRCRNLPAAITLQAYLYRSGADLARLVEEGAAVRLVKGAFAESKRVAWTRPREIDASYLALARTLLSPKARVSGVTPIFATHDDGLIQRLLEMVQAAQWPAAAFEFEMLYGVRPGLQKRLVDQGWSVRVYLPFGEDWWPYAVRRVGENIRNARFLLRAVTRPAS